MTAAENTLSITGTIKAIKVIAKMEYDNFTEKEIANQEIKSLIQAYLKQQVGEITDEEIEDFIFENIEDGNLNGYAFWGDIKIKLLNKVK